MFGVRFMGHRTYVRCPVIWTPNKCSVSLYLDIERMFICRNEHMCIRSFIENGPNSIIPQAGLFVKHFFIVILYKVLPQISLFCTIGITEGSLHRVKAGKRKCQKKVHKIQRILPRIFVNTAQEKNPVCANVTKKS